jgi:hypothetical protein
MAQLSIPKMVSLAMALISSMRPNRSTFVLKTLGVPVAVLSFTLGPYHSSRAESRLGGGQDALLHRLSEG